MIDNKEFSESYEFDYEIAITGLARFINDFIHDECNLIDIVEHIFSNSLSFSVNEEQLIITNKDPDQFDINLLKKYISTLKPVK